MSTLDEFERRLDRLTGESTNVVPFRQKGPASPAGTPVSWRFVPHRGPDNLIDEIIATPIIDAP